jgi:hypothetical protein
MTQKKGVDPMSDYPRPKKHSQYISVNGAGEVV